MTNIIDIHIHESLLIHTARDRDREPLFFIVLVPVPVPVQSRVMWVSHSSHIAMVLVLYRKVVIFSKMKHRNSKQKIGITRISVKYKLPS